ncbi:hypothetical protein I7I48_01025 [Histoplasma ohiense]|nr:hypothetical protein I7I48_01025 [Histoplasma ohiense (nom. inval.)]
MEMQLGSTLYSLLPTDSQRCRMRWRRYFHECTVHSGPVRCGRVYLFFLHRSPLFFKKYSSI